MKPFNYTYSECLNAGLPFTESELEEIAALADDHLDQDIQYDAQIGRELRPFVQSLFDLMPPNLRPKWPSADIETDRMALFNFLEELTK